VRTINPIGLMYALIDHKGTSQRKSMAKSSINFAKASNGGLNHNDRTEAVEPKYLLPHEHRLENELDFSAKEAKEKLTDLYSAAKSNYQNKFNQKLQAKSYTWEAVINLNKEHTLQDVQELTRAIEKETGFTSVQIAIHRDEGRMERGTPIYNLHAHVTFFTLDQSTGQQLYRKSITPQQAKTQPNLKPMNRARLSELQTLTAKELGMERGKEGSKAVRLGHKEFKQSKQKELAKQKDLKSEIAELRAELQAHKATRADYAELEELNKELKERIKDKDLTIDELKNELEAKISVKTTESTPTELKNDLMSIYRAVPSIYEIEEAQRRGAGFAIHRFIEDKGTKGIRSEKISWLYKKEIPTITFDEEEIKELKENLQNIDKVQIGLAKKVLKAYDNEVFRNREKFERNKPKLEKTKTVARKKSSGLSM